jgi:hypothetical protein
MMTQTARAARGLVVETALTALACRLATLPPPPNWRDEVMESYKDQPALDEVMALGRACHAMEPSPDASRRGGTAGSVWQRPASPPYGDQVARSRRRPHRPLRMRPAGVCLGDRAPWPAVFGPADEETYHDHR